MCKISVEQGKEIAMMQDNELGALTRKYFIAVEKMFKENRQNDMDKSYKVLFPLTDKLLNKYNIDIETEQSRLEEIITDKNTDNVDRVRDMIYEQDAFLIEIQNMYDWSDREELLIKYYKKIA